MRSEGIEEGILLKNSDGDNHDKDEMYEPPGCDFGFFTAV